MFFLKVLIITLFFSSTISGHKDGEEPVEYERIDCSKGTFLIDLLLETCVRRELSLTLKRDDTARGHISQLSQYTDVWSKCAETTLDTECNTFRSDTSIMRKHMRLHMLKMWSNMDKLVFAWEQNRKSPISSECRESLQTYTGRTCLPIIIAYTHRYGDFGAIDNFLDCIKIQLQLCDKESQAYFLNLIRKNIKFRIALSEQKSKFMKECIEIMNKTKIEMCSPGLYDLLNSLVFERMLIEQKIKIPVRQQCIFDELRLCDSRGVETITDVAKIFLNISLLNTDYSMFRSDHGKRPFILMPEDRLEIRKCLLVTNKFELEECLPGLHPALKAISEGNPLKTSILRLKGTGCLGIAFKKCSGSMRFIIEKVYYGLYKVNLGIPFDKNSLLSPPGRYEKVFMEILYPPYNLSDILLQELTDCVHSALNAIEICCGGLTDALFRVLNDKTLPYPIQRDSDCSEVCYRDALRVCSPKGRSYTESLIKSIKLVYIHLEKLGIDHLPPSPPYNISVDILEIIDDCIQDDEAHTLEKMCPGMFEIWNSILRNVSLPPKRLTPTSCTYENLIRATIGCNETSALYLRVLIAFLFNMYEQSPSSMEMFYHRKLPEKNGKKLMSFSTEEELAISQCLRENELQMKACCPELFTVIAATVLNVPMHTDREGLKWCSKLCYEPFAFLCQNSQIMLELIDAIIYDYRADYESFDSLVHISPFPPFNLPDQVKQTIGLCVRMMKKKLAQCCPVMLNDLHATLNDHVWNEKNSCEIVCPFDCLKNAVEDCYPEGGDLTLGLMIHIFYCKDVYAAIKDCLQRVASELMICCPSATEAIISIHRGHYFPWNETKLGHCDVLCVMQKISHCDKQDINMIQKLFKYTIDYLQKDVNNYDQGTNVAPVRDLRNINKCFEVMEPILEICCPAMKGAVYTLLNSEPWPLIDGPNLKRCNYFCYRLAAQKCSPDTALFASSVMNQAVSMPAIGYEKFTENCHSIISEALSCCDAIVLSVFQKGLPYNDISFKSRECRSVCKMRLISDCLAHSGNYEHFAFLIKSHFDPSNANISRAALKYKEDLMLSPLMDKDLMHRSRQIVEEPVETEKTVVIPLLMKERARSCIYLVHRDAVDECWPGFYDFVLYLCNRIKYKPLSLPSVNANQCLQDIFKVCSVESNLIISSLVETYLNTTVQLVEENIPNIPRDVIDEETKRMVQTCLQEIDPRILQDCMPSFQRIMTGILQNGQSLANFKPKGDSKDCQAEVFGVCSMQARLLIMKIFYQFQGIVLKIPIVFKTSHVNVMRLISENEKLLVDECLMTVNEDEANNCLPDLYLILSGLSVGLFEISSANNSWQVCLKHVFRHCSRHTRFIITDLIKFVTGNTVSIQSDYSKSMKSEQIITIAERELVTPCLAVVDQALLKQCAPELLDVIATIMNNRRPSTNLYPIRILSSSCFEPAFKNCSADARLILTELVSRHMMTYVSLLFAVSGNGTIDSEMVNILNECVETVNQEMIVGCIIGLQDLLEKFSSGILPSSNIQLKLEAEAEPSCPKEIFSGCSTYHRILIDELLRKSHHEFKNTVLFEIFNPTELDSGLHVHNFIDEQILKECFSTLNQQSLEYCVPGLHNALEKFMNFSLSETFLALKPIKRWCLDMNFAHCTYQARILINDLFFDFYRFTVDLPLEKSPEGLSANMGPPLDYVQKCIFDLDKKEVDLCSPGLSVYLRQTFLKNEEGFKPILSAGKENQIMKCLTRALKCDLDISVHILKSIAEMNNINFHVQLTEQNNESNGWQIAFKLNRVNETR